MLSKLRQSAQAAVRTSRRLVSARTVDVLVVGDPEGIAQAQIDPIRELVEADGITAAYFLHEEINAGNLHRRIKRGCLAAALVQHSWPFDDSRTHALIAALREQHPGVRVAFLDWVAPLHLPDPDVLPLVDVYIKKQVLRDRSRYERGMPDTNLIEYEAGFDAGFGDEPIVSVDAELLESKLLVGWNFAPARKMTALLDVPVDHDGEGEGRMIAMHCRICAPSVEADPSWYGHMRRRAYDAAVKTRERFTGQAQVQSEAARLPYDDYLAELRRSKTCFSPFGYGEVCWRDFEAVACGAALLKPDMSHLETHPDLFVPDETYLPVAWDFADLGDQLQRLLDDEDLRRRLVDTALERWKHHLTTELPALWRQLTERLELRSMAAA